VTLRPAGPDDAEALWSLLEPVFRAGETYCVPRDIDRAGALAFWCDPPHRVWIAEDVADGTLLPLGTFYLTPNQQGPGSHVANCGYVTAAAAQGRGVARAMLGRSLDEARVAGFRAMQYNCVVATNARAIATWKAAGFVEVGRLPGVFAHPVAGDVDALVLHRWL
jgi:RimJ/RimL family protein N-acetyltransferase